MDKVNKIEEFCKDTIVELEKYLVDDDYNELEKHDCKVAIEQYEFILRFINRL